MKRIIQQQDHIISIFYFRWAFKNMFTVILLMSLILNQPVLLPWVICWPSWKSGAFPFHISAISYIPVWHMFFFLVLLRTSLLILATTAMGGAWLLEQPRSSIVLWHPRIRLLWRLLPQVAKGWPKSLLEDICFYFTMPHLCVVSSWILFKENCKHHMFFCEIVGGSGAGVSSMLVGRAIWGSNMETTRGMVLFTNSSMSWSRTIML